jgi:hypothetical protein
MPLQGLHVVFNSPPVNSIGVPFFTRHLSMRNRTKGI